MPDDKTGDSRWCFAWMEGVSASPGKFKAAALKAAMWNPGDLITISFLDGEKLVKQRVEQAARQWVGLKAANLTLVFQKKTDSLIRISFKARGSWSALGNTCMNIPSPKPTMNFGWLTPMTPLAELERVVLHEFGHALGLVHEHQNPAGKIKWNRERVASDLSGPPHFWTSEQIERNMFEPYKKKESNFSKFDSESIMLYPIPKTWTANGFSTALNRKLSKTDVDHIRRMYPWD